MTDGKVLFDNQIFDYVQTNSTIIPVKIAENIAEYLPINDLIFFGQVSKNTYKAFNSGKLWIARLKKMDTWSKGSTSHVTELPKEFNNPLTVFDNTLKIESLAKIQVLNIHKQLEPFYTDLLSMDFNNLKIFKNFKNPVDQCKLLINLKQYNKIDLVNGELIREKIDSILELFENAILRELEINFDNENYEKAKIFTKILTDLQNEQTLIDFFLQKTLLDDPDKIFNASIEDFFIQHEKFTNITDESESYYYLLNVGQFEKFISQLTDLFNEESKIIDLIFTQQIPMMYKLSEEIISNHFVEYFNRILEKSKSFSSKSFQEKEQSNLFIQIIPLAYTMMIKMVDHLKPCENMGPTYHKLIQELIDLYYEPFILDYFEEELMNFQSSSLDQVNNWNSKIREKETKQASEILKNVKIDTKKDLITSFKKIFTINNRDVRSETGTNDEIENELEENAKYTEFEAKVKILNENLKNLTEIFSLELSMNIINSGKKATNRLITFQSSTNNKELGKLCNSKAQDIFIELIECVGFKHIKPGFDKAILYLKNYNPSDFQNQIFENDSVEPLILFTELVNIADLIQQMISIFYQEELINKKIINRNSILTPALQSKKKFEALLDNYVADGLNIGIDVLMNEIESIFQNIQKSTDYNPLPNQPLQIGPTPAAIKIVELLSNHVNLLVGSTEQGIIDVFQQEIGERFFNLICKNLKRQVISTQGAITLISDLNYYYDFIIKLRQKSINPYFISLKKIGTMFLISGEDSKSIGKLMSDLSKFNGIFQQEEIYEFLQKRADWINIKKDVEKVMYGFGLGDCTIV